MGIREIADKASVSIATVSRVLNNTKPVSAEIRSRVLNVIEQEGYSPNHAARTMVLRKTQTAGLIIPEISELFHQHIFRSVEQVLVHAGYRLIVCHVRDESDSELSYLDLLGEHKVDGIILMHETEHEAVKKRLQSSELPIVQCGIRIAGLPRPVVGIDEFHAAFDGTRYLLDQGHEHIGYIGGHGPSVGENRLSGFRQALGERGLEIDEKMIAYGEYTLESGRSAAVQLAERTPEITAVFAASDEMALGAIRGLTELGRRVPQDTSVLGFDGIELGSYATPALSTVYQPISDIGRESSRLLIELMDDPERDVPDISLPHRIVERESCAPPSA
jgi:LacI family transcriptional regulator